MATGYQSVERKPSLARKMMWVMIILVVSVIGFTSGALMYIYSQVKNFDQVFADGIFVEEVYIGRLTKDEAKHQIISKLEEINSKKSIILYGSNQEYPIPYTEFDVEYNIDEVLDNAFKIGHEGNIIQRFQVFTSKNVSKNTFNLKHSYSKEKVDSIIKSYSDKFLIKPEDATMVRKDRKFIITPEKPGQELDVTATAKKTYKLFDNQKDGKVEVVITPTKAKKTSQYFEKVQNPISSFYTSYNNSDLNRNTNLVVGAKTINSVVEPGETFSLAEHLEPITYNNGYRSSKVIVNGKLVDGIGGGICQVASTLYNSVLLTNLKVTQRQNHSLPVGYIPLGRDATYASNVIDFKFTNPTDYPVYIESYNENNRLYVNIYGHESLKPDNEIKFESVTTEVIPAPEPKYVDDPTLPKGEKKQELAAIDGKKVNLYKCIYKDGKLIDKILESKSYYRPRAAVIHVGTKEDSIKETINQDIKEQENKNQEVPVIEDTSFMDLYEEQF